MNASKPLPVTTPPELSDGLPEALTEALIASEFRLNDVIDSLIETLNDDEAGLWKGAPTISLILTRLVLPQHRYQEALEQALVEKIRSRIRAVYG